MWLLRTMLWSGLFDRYAIVQATSIWWMNDVEGGGLSYWPDGPDEPPHEHVGDMANTALVGDNHGMFHQVGPVGPFDQGPTRFPTSGSLFRSLNNRTPDCRTAVPTNAAQQRAAAKFGIHAKSPYPVDGRSRTK